MKKQDKLELFRDYNDYLEPKQVCEFIDYCEWRYNSGEYDEPESLLYDWFAFDSWKDWFNGYEHDQFDEMYRKPFLEEHPEYEDQEDEVDEILRDLMYELDMYDAWLKHFNKDYDFYILTNPELTYELYDERSPFVEYTHKYLKHLQKSQWRTKNSRSMRELIRSGWYNGLGICVKVNMWLFEFIDLMRAKKLIVKKWSDIFMFNPYIWTGWDTTTLTSDWKFTLKLKEIWFGCDDCKGWPWWYTPDEVYGRYHPAFNKNKIDFSWLKK